MIPEQVEKILRQKLPNFRICHFKANQVTFSRWSSMYRQRKLQEPTDYQAQKNGDNFHDGNDFDDEEDVIDLETEEGISQSVLL